MVTVFSIGMIHKYSIGADKLEEVPLIKMVQVPSISGFQKSYLKSIWTSRKASKGWVFGPSGSTTDEYSASAMSWSRCPANIRVVLSEAVWNRIDRPLEGPLNRSSYWDPRYLGSVYFPSKRSKINKAGEYGPRKHELELQLRQVEEAAGGPALPVQQYRGCGFVVCVFFTYLVSQFNLWDADMPTRAHLLQ